MVKEMSKWKMKREREKERERELIDDNAIRGKKKRKVEANEDN